MTDRLIPNGICWCGCGRDAGRGSFFLQGHDKYAEAGVILMKYGGVAQLITHHGYGPNGKNLRIEYEKWKDAGGRAR